MAKPPRVPPLVRRHEWVILGTFEIPVSDSEVNRITNEPDDIAVNWRERAQLVAASKPGCQVCGGIAADVQGSPCPGASEFERKVTQQAVRDKIWTPEE
jgi:hypothetical protein